MFKIQHKPSFKTDVFLSIAGEPEGKKLEVEFKYFTKTGIRDLMERHQGGTEADMLGEAIVSWDKDVLGVDYTRETLVALLDEFPAAGSDFIIAFRRELVESKRKN